MKNITDMIKLAGQEKLIACKHCGEAPPQKPGFIIKFGVGIFCPHCQARFPFPENGAPLQSLAAWWNALNELSLDAKIVELKRDRHRGKKFVVTWWSNAEQLLRATPIGGDPMESIGFKINEVVEI